MAGKHENEADTTDAKYIRISWGAVCIGTARRIRMKKCVFVQEEKDADPFTEQAAILSCYCLLVREMEMEVVWDSIAELNWMELSFSCVFWETIFELKNAVLHRLRNWHNNVAFFKINVRCTSPGSGTAIHEATDRHSH
jgi:hypothetical protein